MASQSNCTRKLVRGVPRKLCYGEIKVKGYTGWGIISNTAAKGVDGLGRARKRKSKKRSHR